MSAFRLTGGVAFLLTASLFGATAAQAASTCGASADAALAAFTHGRYSQMPAYFSPAIAGAASPAALQSAWGQLTAAYGAFDKAGAITPRTVQGRRVLVAPLAFAHGSLALVMACDASARLVGFRVVPAAAAGALPPVKAHVEADGVRVEPLAVPSTFGPLRGALTLPAGKGPFPAVVLVAGSGPHDMDETVDGNKPFRDIADGLAKLGIASLRYDKRTFDYPEHTAANSDMTVDDEVTDDALTALRLLAKQPQVDPQRVFVLGHSLGAQMAPRIAERAPRLAGVIMLAAPARPILTVIADQIRRLGPEEHAPAATVKKQEQAIAAERRLLSSANPAHPPHGTFGQSIGAAAPQSYWLSWQDVDQVATAQKLEQPILILQGGNDFQVSPIKDFDAWKRALAGRANVTFHLFPGLSHLFMPGPTRSPADYARPAHVDPAVIGTIAKWIKAQPAVRH